MLNWHDFSRLLMILIGAVSGLGSAREMKSGTSVVIIFAFIGAFLGFGMGAATFKLERWLKKLPAGMRPLLYFLIPFVGILAAWLAPVLLALIILGHK